MWELCQCVGGVSVFGWGGGLCVVVCVVGRGTICVLVWGKYFFYVLFILVYGIACKGMCLLVCMPVCACVFSFVDIRI